MQLIRFGFVGVVNTLIDFGLLNLLFYLADHPSGAGLLVCNGIAFFVASLNSYSMNKNWTFSDKNPGTVSQFVLFMLFTLTGLAINSGIIYLLTMPAVSPESVSVVLWVNIAKATATLISMFWNFSSYRRFVFRSPCLPR
jgi:putative flippase GtrA